MSTGSKRPYAQVYPIAQRVMEGLAPVCQWIELAGSLRRQKAMIGDVEIVAVATDGRLYEALDARLADGKIQHLAKKRWGQKLRSFLFMEIQFDVFIQPDPQTLGVNFMIRTGSAEFSHKMVTKRCLGGWMPDGYNVKDARVWCGDVALATPNEAAVFALWNMAYVEPELRTDEYVPQWVTVAPPQKKIIVPIDERPIYLPDTLPTFGGREGARLAAVAAMKQKPTQPATKRHVGGIDGEQNDAALGPMFAGVNE